MNAFEYADFSYLRQILEDFWDNSWKTLGRLLRKYSNVFYARSLEKVFQSLMPKVVQRDDVKWSPSLSMLRNNILIVNYFVNLKRC